ncbi:MAG: hypothetical protein FGF48_08015 [Candidatus Brockarchaeota archaeon]|nr:hypothetical protein [Candidatus Brockarchaeota archaeon]
MGNIVDSYFDVKGKHGEDIAEASCALEEVLTKFNVFDFSTKRREILLKRGNHHTFALGSDNELEEGGYIIKVHWRYEEEDRAVSGEMKFPYIKEFKSDIINIPARKVNEVLDAIGKDEAKIVATKVETSDYRASFFVETSVAGVRIRLNLFDNEMEIRGKVYSFVPKVNSKGPRKVTVGVAGRLRDLLIEKFREDQGIREVGILSYPLRGVK